MALSLVEILKYVEFAQKHSRKTLHKTHLRENKVRGEDLPDVKYMANRVNIAAKSSLKKKYEIT